MISFGVNLFYNSQCLFVCSTVSHIASSRPDTGGWFQEEHPASNTMSFILIFEIIRKEMKKIETKHWYGLNQDQEKESMTHPQFWNYADDDDDNEFIVYIYICYRVARYILQLYSNSTYPDQKQKALNPILWCRMFSTSLKKNSKTMGTAMTIHVNEYGHKGWTALRLWVSLHSPWLEKDMEDLRGLLLTTQFHHLRQHIGRAQLWNKDQLSCSSSLSNLTSTGVMAPSVLSQLRLWDRQRIPPMDLKLNMSFVYW